MSSSSLAISSMVVQSRLRVLRLTEIALCKLIRRQRRDKRTKRSTSWRLASRREWHRRLAGIRNHICRRDAHRSQLVLILLRATISNVNHPRWSIDSTMWRRRTWASLTTSIVFFSHSSAPRVITIWAYRMPTTLSASPGHVPQSEALIGRQLGTKWAICPL